MKDKRQLVLRSFYKNYEHFDNKLYKGLEFKTGAEVKAFEIGKVGIAKGYQPIKSDF